MNKVKLFKCGKFISSPKISTSNLTLTNYITTDNMLPNKRGIIEAEKLPDNVNVIRFLEKDILISNIRPYFKKIWYAKFNGGCSPDILVFRTNDKYDAAYIMYCLSQDAFFKYDMAGAKGSKMPRGDKQHILNFELIDADLAYQKRVSKILSILDSKIELNNKINAELEKIAKTLYDYWFVQFDFLDENNRPYKSSGGAMVYNEELKREIPKGWEVKELREIAPISNEQLTPEEDVVYRYYSIPDYDRQGTYVLDYGKNIHSNKFVVLPCDVLVSKLNPRFCRVICAGNKTKMISSTEFVVFRCNTETNQTLIRSIAVSDSFRDFCIANATGSSGSHNRIRPDIMGSFKIPYKDSVCNSFKNRLSSVIQKLLLVTQEKRELSELRDFLLPMLMNGQVKVI